MNNARNREARSAVLERTRVNAMAAGRFAAVLIVAPLLSACGGGGLETAGLPSPSQLSLPKLTELPSLPRIDLPKPALPVVGTPTEVYERVGRGAVSCWLGGKGPLKGSHVYEAEAESAHKGGRAEIAIRERDPGAPNPRGVKAFRIAIEPAGEDKAAITTENLRLPDALARQMIRNVEAWGAGTEGCDAGGEVAGSTLASTPAVVTRGAGVPAEPAAPKKRNTSAAATAVPAAAQSGVGRASR